MQGLPNHSRGGAHQNVGGNRALFAVEVDGAVLAQLLETVVRVDHANGAGFATHHDGLRAGAAAVVTDAAQEVTVGDAGGAEEDVLARDEIFGGQDPIEIVTGVDGLLTLFVVGGGPACPAAIHPCSAWLLRR